MRIIALIFCAVMFFNAIGITHAAEPQPQTIRNTELRDNLQALMDTKLDDALLAKIRETQSQATKAKGEADNAYVAILTKDFQLSEVKTIEWFKNREEFGNFEAMRAMVNATKGAPLVEKGELYLRKKVAEYKIIQAKITQNEVGKISELTKINPTDVSRILNTPGLRDRAERVVRYDFNPSSNRGRELKQNQREKKEELRKQRGDERGRIPPTQ